MKNLLLLIFCSFSFCSFGQVHFAMPPEANSFYNSAMPLIKPAIRNLIKRNANNLRSGNVDTDSLAGALKKDPLLKGMNQHSLEAITVLIMIQASKNADEDLKNLVIKIREANDPDSTEISKGTEAIIDHKSKIAETIAGVMKKISSSQESAISNLR